MTRPAPAPPPLKPQEFQEICGVPADTLERLQVLAGLLEKWQAKVNLVSQDSLADLWRRHILDSAQVFRLLPPAARTVADIGSGAGFPGLVLAIMGRGGPARFHLVESNQRKCAFLGEVNRLTQSGAEIHHGRVEKLPRLNADVITARALAPLTKLLEYANLHLAEGGQCIFLKGKQWREELTEVRKSWIMKESNVSSISDSSGMVLKLEGLSRRDHR